MKVVGLILVFFLIIIIDLPAIVKKEKHKGKYLVIYGLIIITTFTISYLQIIDKAPMSPSVFIESIVKVNR